MTSTAREPTRRVAVVSGGSRGIGRATVLRLARDGFDVGFCYHSDERAAKELAECGPTGARIVGTRVDVRDGAAVRAWIADVERDLGPIDAAVCCAGIIRDGPLVMMSDEDWTRVVGTSLDGAFHVCRAAVFGMMKRRRGSLVTISSVSGVYGNANQTNYSAAKAGIIGFTRALAKEAGRCGVRSNAVAAGLVDTDMTAHLREQVRRRLLEAIPLGRFGRADEVADLVSYLVSDAAAYVNGAVVEIHGGISI